MRAVVFGTLRFDRRSIPVELADISHWPSADDTVLDDGARALFERRVHGMTLFVDGTTTLSAIGRETGLRVNDLYRMFERCIAPHEDGRIYGCRALLPWVHTRPYERNASVSRSDGASGAFSQLLRRYPEIARWIKRKVEDRCRRGNGLEEIHRQNWSLHADFLKQCRHAGIQAHEYPFNREHLGARSLSTHVRKLAQRRFASAARAAGAGQIQHEWREDVAEVRKIATYPYEVVEFDGHKLDVRLTLRIDDPFGFETLLVMHRIWILVLFDVASRAVIGYALAPGREHNRDDVAQALQDTLAPHHVSESVIPGLRIKDGGGFPSEVIPQTAWACWSTLRFDAAKAHFAKATLERLTTVVGCTTDNGPLGEKNERAFVERFFDQLASHFAHRLPATTGRDPRSVERALSDVGGDTSLIMTLDELEDVVDVVLANYNGEPHAGLGGRSPLEAMQFQLSKREGLLRTVPEARRSTLCLLQEARIVTICGNVSKGVRPHVNFEYVRYDSRLLSGMTRLIGQKIRVYFNVKDVRQLHAFFMDGAELGVLTASRPWCFTPHSLRVRQEIFSLTRQRKLAWRDGEDPVGAWFAWKKDKARKHAREANDLARMLTDRAKTHAPPSPRESTSAPENNSPATADVVSLPAPSLPKGEKTPWLTKIFTY